MRTREEQIAHILNVMRNSSSDVTVAAIIAEIILEAERRAEQRVRAEIAERVSKLFDSYGAYDRPCKQFVMGAIDAEREVG